MIDSSVSVLIPSRDRGGMQPKNAATHATAMWHTVNLYSAELKEPDGVIAHYPENAQIRERAVEAQQALSVAEQALRQLVLALRKLEDEGARA